MGMKRCILPSILLMLALQAALLVAGRPSVDGEVGAILLPSQGQAADQQTVMAAPKRPWKCCDRARCTRSIPPICTCVDEAFECASTCKACVPSTRNPSLKVCQDQYVGDPGPICRPWECCDSAACTKTDPPTCRCGDEVEQCAPTCKTCKPSTSDPSLNVCMDAYTGAIPPTCTPEALAAGGN
ncbi:hypothetical protein ACQJBY_073335 [Aegilops geniculata]